MPSPFPGMDPYLEDPAFWPDFHDRFIVYWRDAINEALPENYEARVNERTKVIDLDTGDDAWPRPDVTIHRGGEATQARGNTAVLTTLEPVTIPLTYFEEVRETYIEIRRRPDRTVVAVLELLSPSNKTGDNRVVYLNQRNARLHQDVHLVELDLLLGGKRIPLEKPLPAGDYHMILSRWEQRPNCEAYSWSLRDRLPTLPIPLQAPDPDILIDFGAVFTTTYDRGRYARALAYQATPVAPVREEERAWVAGLVKREP